MGESSGAAVDAKGFRAVLEGDAPGDWSGRSSMNRDDVGGAPFGVSMEIPRMTEDGRDANGLAVDSIVGVA